MKRRRILALAGAVCLVSLRAEASTLFFPTDTTIDTVFGQFDNFVVGYKDDFDLIHKQNGTSPTMTIVGGARVFGVSAFNQSTISVSGGSICGGLTAPDSGTISVSSTGPLDLSCAAGLGAGGSSAISMSGGVVGSVRGTDSASLNVTGGLILIDITLGGSGTGSVNSVTVGYQPNGVFLEGSVLVAGSAHLNVSSTEVGLDATARGNSHLTLTGSTIHGGVSGNNSGQDTSSLQIIGSNIGGGVDAYDLTMGGGTVGGGVSVFGAGAAGTVSDTQIGGSLSVVGPGSATLAASNVTAAGANASSGGALSLSNSHLNGGVNVLGSSIGASSAVINGGSVNGDVVASIGGSTERNATLVIDGAAITGGITAGQGSTLTFVSGTVEQNVLATGAFPLSAIVAIQGGTIKGSVVVDTASELTMTGGAVGRDLQAKGGGSKVNFSGGTIQGNLNFSGREAIMSGGLVLGAADISGDSFTMTGGTITRNATIGGTCEMDIQNGVFLGNLTVNLLATGTISGGSIAGDLTFDEFSDVHVTGGQIAKTLLASGNAQVEMSGGQAHRLGAQDVSTLSIKAGLVDDVAAVADSATLKVSGTALLKDELNAFGNGNLEFSGGSAKSVGITENAKLNLSGSAFVLEKLLVMGSGTANISGGKVGGDLVATDSSNVSITDGTFSNAGTRTKAVLSVHGGAFSGDITSAETSVITLSGGTVSGGVASQDDSKVLVEGTTFIGREALAINNSTLTMSGGGVGGNVSSKDTAKLNIISNGAFIAGDVSAIDKSSLTISGGNIGGSVNVDGESTLEFSGGTILNVLKGGDRASIGMTGGVVTLVVAEGSVPTAGFTMGGGQITKTALASNHATMLLVGGSVGRDVDAFLNSTVELESTAAIADELHAFDFSRVNMSGGSVGLNLRAEGNATINLSGGNITGVVICSQNSTVNVTGAAIASGVVVNDQCRFTLSGHISAPQGGPQAAGKPQTAASNLVDMTVSGQGTVTAFGAGLAATLIDPNFQGQFSKYQLSGVLADGSSVDGGFLLVKNGDQATFHFLPGANWNINGGGSWNSAANWASGVVPNETGARAGLLGGLTAPNAPATITLDGNRTLGSLSLDNPNSYIVQPGTGGSLTLNNLGSTAEINVFKGQHTIAAPVVLADPTSIYVANEARLAVQSLRGKTPAITNGLVQVIPGEGPGGASDLAGIAVDVGAALDLSDNDLIIRNGDLSAISALIASGRNFGHWDGNGIRSSNAAAAPNNGLAVVLNTLGLSSFDGLPVGPSDVLIKYTLNGDTDLNGRIDADDYARIDQGFANKFTGYANGDFDFSGKVDADDYFLIDRAFSSQGAALSASPVPEPTSIAIICIGLIRLLRRRQGSPNVSTP